MPTDEFLELSPTIALNIDQRSSPMLFKALLAKMGEISLSVNQGVSSDVKKGYHVTVLQAPPCCLAPPAGRGAGR